MVFFKKKIHFNVPVKCKNNRVHPTIICLSQQNSTAINWSFCIFLLSYPNDDHEENLLYITYERFALHYLGQEKLIRKKIIPENSRLNLYP